MDDDDNADDMTDDHNDLYIDDPSSIRSATDDIIPNTTRYCKSQPDMRDVCHLLSEHLYSLSGNTAT